MKKEKFSRSGDLVGRKWAFLSRTEQKYIRIRRKLDGSFAGAYQKVFDDDGSQHFKDQVCSCGDSRRILAEFVQSISHGLKTPVTSLRLVSQLQKRKLASGDPSVFDEKSMARWIDLIDRQTARLNRVIEDLSSGIDSLESGLTHQSVDESKSARACYDANESH